MATVVGVFSRHGQAEKAVRTLRDEGFGENEISIAAKDNRGGEGGEGEKKGGAGGFSMEAGAETMTRMDTNVGDGAAWGGALGGLAGLLAGAGALAIPGIGPILAAGPLAAALSGAVAGGIAGGLIDMGIPETEGKRFEEDVKSGKALAIIKCDGEKAKRAESILRECGADEVRSYNGQNGNGRAH